MERLFFEPILVMFYFALVTSIAYLALNWGAFTTELAMFEPGMLFSDGVLNHVLALNLRVVTALWIGRLLLFTTSISDLLHGLRKLHVPGILINLLAVTFRYIYVLAGELQNVTVAKELRAPVVKGTVKRLKALGNVYAAALNRSLLRSTNVAIAMELRGSTSNFIARTPAFSRSKSILFVACMISIVALVFAFPDPAAILGLA